MPEALNLPRGIRNNNPGNIKDFDIPWDGLVFGEDRAPDQRDEKIFCVFKAPWWGIRAMVRIVQNYHDKHSLRTLREFMKRWAPGEDNNPEAAYLSYVSAHTGFSPDALFPVRNVHVMRQLIRAIIKFENGYDPYTWEVDLGLVLAGLDPQVDRSLYVEKAA